MVMNTRSRTRKKKPIEIEESSEEEEESSNEEETEESSEESEDGEESSEWEEDEDSDIQIVQSTKKPTKKASKPSVFMKVSEAITNCIGSGSDVTRVRIYKYIGETYPGTSMASARRAIAKGLEDGSLEHGRTTARFKLTSRNTKAIVKKAVTPTRKRAAQPPVKKKTTTAHPPVKKKKPVAHPPVKKKKPQKSGDDDFDTWLNNLDSVEPYVEPPANDSDDEFVVKRKSTKKPVCKKGPTQKRKKPTITDYEPPKKKRRTNKTTKGPKTTKPVPEKRLKRKRSCTSGVRQRISRALTQRLYMVNWEEKSQHERVYKVLGSTGNLYTITIGTLVSCSCPDFRKGNLCKHCLFVMLKVLRVNRNDEKVWQRALLTSELEEIFDAAPELNMLTGVRADTATRKAVNKATGKEDGSEEEESTKQKPLEGNECCICLEDFDAKADKNKVVWCKTQCGNNIHTQCFEMYANNQGNNVSCPFCRAPWPVKGGKGGKAKKKEGYMNFSSTSGQSQYRDTSTYHRNGWNGYGYGGWYGGYRRRYRGW